VAETGAANVAGGLLAKLTDAVVFGEPVIEKPDFGEPVVDKPKAAD